ncbi:MAG: DNA-binding protein, partial [Pseudomonadota bacterium]|nr:DNA-binding protein [Pseudomonadota bacterium]
AENNDTEYVAYVSEQNLLGDDLSGPVRHPKVNEYFSDYDTVLNRYIVKAGRSH